MFRVHLGELERGEPLRIHRWIAGDDELWEGSELVFAEPVEVEVALTLTTTGQVVAKGEARTTLRQDCRRCLKPLQSAVLAPVDLIWSPPDQLDEPSEEGEDSIRLLPRGDVLELGEAIREEFLLAVPMYPLCREDCRGLCPQCGVDWNEKACDCVQDGADPRWAALRTLTED